MKTPLKIFLRLTTKFDIATSLFRSFELFAVKDVLNELDISSPILDIGCAEGYVGRHVFFDKKIDEIFGLDYDTAYLSAAKQLGFYKYLIASDATSMPFKNNFFYFLFSNSVLEHIKDIDCVLKETERILKSKGLFLFTVPNDRFSNHLFFYIILNFMGLKKIADLYSSERNKRLNHFHLYSQNEWKELISKYGLEVVCIKEYISGLTLFLWDLIAASQFILKKIFYMPLKIIFIREILMFLGCIIKMLVAIFMLPLYIFLRKDIKEGCATLVLARKK